VFIDANSIEKKVLDVDICIVGSGAAGIALATSFANQKWQVSLLESGSLEYDSNAQALADGPTVGLDCGPLIVSRLRYFGGTTNHWGGYCRAFSEQDFLPRVGIPLSGWPITRTELDPYYSRAHKFLQLHPDLDIPAWEEKSGYTELPLNKRKILTRLVQIIWPKQHRRLGEVYLSKIKSTENIQVILNANVTDFITNESGRTVSYVQVATLAGKTFSVAARQFILATGGIENPRLLLLANKNQPKGLGNENDMVGRYFMEHPRFTGAIIQPSHSNLPLKLYKAHRVDETLIKGYLVLPDSMQQAERLLDVQVRLSPEYQLPYTNVGKSRGASSLRTLWDNLRDGEIGDDFSRHLGNVIEDIDDIVASAYAWARFRGNYPVEQISMVPRIAQVPNPDSRVTLANDVDSLNLRKAQLDWRLTDLDRQSALRTMQVIGAEMGRAGLGRMKILLSEESDSWPDDLRGGWHHMGTTRMSDDPKSGVVDRNCRVHSVKNLYIAGSSVFPTAGSGTPTFCLVALAFRLADYLKEKMR
jgi:choline dehydrogenase-like flavoprotein